MSSTRSPSMSLAMTGTALLVFFGLVAFFLGPNLFDSRDSNAGWYVLHIVGGSLVLLLGPLQFVAPLRNRFRGYHRLAGYTYIVASGMAVAGYAGLPKQQEFLTSQLMVLGLWMACLVLAVRAVLAGKILSHQHNMARSFVLASYFLTVRIVDRYLMDWLEPLASDKGVRFAHSDWLAWLVPLLAVELSFTLKAQSSPGGRVSGR